MTRTPELTAINCTSCGAGLDILGGGRVKVHVCPYCGSELDAQDKYKVLRQYTDRKRPDTPLSIGMRGTVFDVDFVLIGIIEHSERWAGVTYRWIDHQLYSPTHGYAWLTLENDHLVFSRRYRASIWMSERQVETAETPPKAYAAGQVFRYYETTTSAITYVEGEFAWQPKLGEQTMTISAMSQTEMLGFSQTGSEREIYRSIYLPKAEAEAAFDTQLDLRPRRTHPLQPFVPGPNYGFLKVTALFFCIACLFLAAVFATQTGHNVLRNHLVRVQDLPAEITLPLRANSKLTSISLQGDVRNSWAYLELELTDPDDVPVFEAGRTIEVYSGRDNEGAWREGSGTTRLYFRPETTGDYTLTLTVPEDGVWRGPGVGHVPDQPISRLTVDVRSGLSTGLWMAVLGGLFGLISLFQFGRRALHNSARWSGSDWTDED